jgi:phosphoglycolate phosphatase-like HAD superfamily hydrolase
MVKVLALDFDGVLCDGMNEYWQTAWQTYLEVWQVKATAPPADLFDRFSAERSAIEYGWEMPILVCALIREIELEELTDNWIATRDRLLKDDGIVPEQLLLAFDRVRDNWIDRDLDGWLACHRFYPGIDRLFDRIDIQQIQPIIITTKEQRFVAKLLASAQINLDREWIWGKEIGRSKADSLKYILDRWGENLTDLAIIEDRWPTLQKIAARPDLAAVKLYLADWGYNTAAERAAGKKSDRIQLIDLEQAIAGQSQ